MAGRLICSIDPGARGAIAFLAEDGRLLDIHDMPVIEIGGKLRVNAQLLRGLFTRKPRMTFIEFVNAVHGSGAANGFAFGQAAGVVEGVCAGLGLPMTYVKPPEWKKALKLSSDKGLSRQLAIRLWPDHAKLFSLVKHADRAEAALIGYYGLQRLKREAA